MHDLTLFTLLAIQEVAAEGGGALLALLDALLGAIQGQTEVFAGILTVGVFGWLKKYITWIDARGVIVQQVLVAFTAAILVTIAQYLGEVLPTNIQIFAEGDVNAWVAAVTAFVLHLARKFIGGGRRLP